MLRDIPEHMLMSEVEIISDGGRRRRWSAAEKHRIVDETLDAQESVSSVARRNGVAPNLLYRWRRLMLEGGAVAVTDDDKTNILACVRAKSAGAKLAIWALPVAFVAERLR